MLNSYGQVYVYGEEKIQRIGSKKGKKKTIRILEGSARLSKTTFTFSIVVWILELDMYNHF